MLHLNKILKTCTLVSTSQQVNTIFISLVFEQNNNRVQYNVKETEKAQERARPVDFCLIWTE